MAKGKKTGGRQAGTPNKITAQLKDAILEAATLAGDQDGLVGYLRTQASANPSPFMALLGKVLPLQLSGDPENPIAHTIETDKAFGAMASALEIAARSKSGGSGSKG